MKKGNTVRTHTHTPLDSHSHSNAPECGAWDFPEVIKIKELRHFNATNIRNSVVPQYNSNEDDDDDNDDDDSDHYDNVQWT